MAIVVGPVLAVEDQSFQGNVASFTSSDVAGGAASSATIQWGDGTSSNGTIIGGAPGNFGVSGIKTYDRPGRYQVVVTLKGTDASNTATSTQGEARVSETNLSLTPTPSTAIAGRSFTGTLATFQDFGGLVGDYSATIQWGTGEATTAGTVTAGANGSFAIGGTYTYPSVGSRTATVALVRVSTGQVAMTTSSVAVVASSLSATGTVIAATANSPFTGRVASFSDPNVGTLASDYTATIQWGPGLPTTVGTITAGASAGLFTVAGTFTYSEAGTRPVAVTINRSATGQTVVANTTAIVESSLSAAGTVISATANTPFTGRVASFSDPNAGTIASDYTATIQWGPGLPTTVGTITAGASAGLFTVAGTFTYSDAGTRPVTVTINRPATGQTVVANSTAIIASSLSASGTVIAATAYTPFTGRVASFSDPNAGTNASDYTATILWGPGLPTTVGTVTAGASAGSFTVAGTFTYSDAGTRPVAITINRPATGQTVVANSTAIVASSLSATGTVIAATANSPFTGRVASFSDPNVGTLASDYTATIQWGPGLPTTVGTITAGASAGLFTVAGTFTYSEAGTRPVAVTINRSATGQTVVANTTAIVESSLSAVGTVIAATANTPFSGRVASFSDPTTGTLASDYSATIQWGPGLPTTVGTVTAGASAGLFTVAGAFTYSEAGTRPVAVTINRSATGQTVVANTTAIVAPAIPVPVIPTLTAVGTSITPIQSKLFTGVVASFTDSERSNLANLFTASIDWGAGEATIGTIVPIAESPGRFDVVGSYAYSDTGSFTVVTTVTRTDTKGTATASTAAIVAAPLVGSGIAIETTAGQPFSGPVASFSDSQTPTNSDPGRFSALIDFGNGDKTPGTIAYDTSSKSFFVFGATTFPTPGTFPVQVTVVRKTTGTAYAFDTSATIHTFTGALDPLVDLGSSNTDGITSDNQPRFLGTVEPLALVRLFARKADSPTAFPIGETISGSNGRWSLTTPPLADGIYTITGEVVPTTGSPYFQTAIATIQIDTVAPRTLGVSYNPKTGEVTATFRDDRSGLDPSRLTNPAYFALLGPGKNRASASRARELPTVASIPSDPRTVVVTFTLAPRFRKGKHSLRVVAGGLTDLAGNAITGKTFAAQVVTRSPHPGQGQTL